VAIDGGSPCCHCASKASARSSTQTTTPLQAWDLVISVENLTKPASGAGTFEFLLIDTDPSGSPAYNVAGFSFELSVPSSSGIQFTAATTSTLSATYIFDGTATLDPSFELSLGTFPTTDVAGSDSEFTYPSIAVGPGATFAFGLISYSVAPDAPAGDIQISFISAGTSLSDTYGKPIAFTPDDSGGVIHIAGSAVPEPSTIMFLSSGIAFLVFARHFSVPSQQQRKA
jgi:hypothetical protein